jgi:N6-L-threonylcarbamoyladenine synthase
VPFGGKPRKQGFRVCAWSGDDEVHGVRICIALPVSATAHRPDHKAKFVSLTTTILGLETSCDETAAAVVRRHADGRGEILSNTVLSQIRDHAPFGGVVPEVAARAHILHIDRIVTKALDDAAVSFDDLDAVAATAGPGLSGGLMIGLTMSKAIAQARGLPFLAINHLEGHALTPRLLGNVAFPYLLLLISGGHTQFQLVRGVGDYKRLGTTIDDALGEAFDKTAKLLGLGYPGGPQVEAFASRGNADRFDFPCPLKGRAGCDFSFSGLKTAVREAAQAIPNLAEQHKSDICAAFQKAVCETMTDRLRNACDIFRASCPDVTNPCLVVAGGVAANAAIRTMLGRETTRAGFELSVPPFHLCTDNAAMIAWAAAERFALGLTDTPDAPVRPRWPLDTVSLPAYGSGRLGAKA